MIRAIILYLLVCVLSSASYCQSQEVLGAWLENPIKWTKPPAELRLKQRLGEAAILYFGPAHVFAMVYGTVIQGPQSEGLSHGDGRVVYLGTWSRNGTMLNLKFRLVSRTVRKEGETLPGPVEAEQAVLGKASLTFEKKRFQRDPRLDRDLEDVAKGEQARRSP